MNAAQLPALRRANTMLVAACLIFSVAGCDTSQDETTVGTNGHEITGTAEATASTSPAQDQVAQATAFWKALASGDREDALGLVDPAATESSRVSPYGRAGTLAGQFDWYEAVGWRWTFDECVMIDSERAQCSAAASNPWSDALDVEPVAAQFFMTFSDAGITSVSVGGVFPSEWGSMVFNPFADWVQQNHPEDAATMFAPEDVNADILALYEVNTERFVEAHENG